jgi:tetratricopeptide (TPR) repeat protein
MAVLYLRPERVDVGCLLISIAVLGVISWLVLRLRRPYLTVGWLWYVVMLLPVSGLAQAGLQSIADRYTYLPTIGLGLMATWGAVGALDAFETGQFGRSLGGATAVVALAACVFLTRHQLAYWRNTETLMMHALAVDPKNYIAYQNLADYYARKGEIEKAIQMRRRIGEFDPAFAKERR